MSSFAKLGLRADLIKALASLRISEPTTAQTLILPAYVRDSRDLLIRSATGTGKTYGLLLGLLNSTAAINAPAVAETVHAKSVQGRGRVIAPHSIVVVPHDDVARQIAGWATSIFNAGPGSDEQSIVKTKTMSETLLSVRTNPLSPTAYLKPRVLISTPNMLVEHMARHELAFDNLEVIVLDEADLLIPPLPRYNLTKRNLRLQKPKASEVMVSKMILACRELRRPKPRIILASASLSSPVRKHICMLGWLKDPVTLDKEKANAVTADVTQFIYTVSKYGQIKPLSLDGPLPSTVDKTQQLLIEIPEKSVDNDPSKAGTSTAVPIIQSDVLEHMLRFIDHFCALHRIEHALLFPKRGLSSPTIVNALNRHSKLHARLFVDNVDISQACTTIQPNERKTEILVVSVLASRGMDFPPHFKHGFLLGAPADDTEYLHVIGRVGRNGHKGTSITLAEDDDKTKRKMRMVAKFVDGRRALPAEHNMALLKYRT